MVSSISPHVPEPAPVRARPMRHRSLAWARTVWLKWILALAVGAVLGGCGGGAVAPVVDASGRASSGATPSVHSVRRGESVYAVAWRYGLDPQRVIAANKLKSPYVVYPGQRLRLTGARPLAQPAAPKASKSDGSARTSAIESPPAPVRRQSAPAPVPQPKRSKPAASGAAKPVAPTPEKPAAGSTSKPPRSTRLTWRWPSAGRLIRRFGSRGSKGIEIAGKKNQPVIAAADGKVVYSGSGLIGYGNLIIVKHDDQYLSAYAHNEVVTVGEGDEVRAGQRIASMGSSGTDAVKLHFEIRQGGKPVDPLAYLPRRP